MGGRRPLRLQRERASPLARIAEKPDLTLRALMAELAERGTGSRKSGLREASKLSRSSSVCFAAPRCSRGSQSYCWPKTE
jgi:predicted DNA-binding ribbon-helix-helix protein